MNIRHWALITLASSSLMCFFSPAASAQPHSCEFWITVSDSNSPSTTATMYFGEYAGATYGVDWQINPTIIEMGTSPPSPWLFGVRWIDIPSRILQDELGAEGGLVPYNFQGFPTNALKCDTFNLAFFDGGRPHADFSFRWPTRVYLAARCDSMLFRYRSLFTDSNGNSGYVTTIVDMFKQDSTVIVHAQDPTFHTYNALIVKYGANMIDEVGAKSPSAPFEFSLHQNYPNPFNPSTTIEFNVPTQSAVTLKVFNIFGEEVATLARNRSFSAGEHSVIFNASNLGSGIYFYHINARSNEGKYFQQIRKMVLLK